MKTYNKPKLFTLSRSHAVVPALSAAAVAEMAQAISAAAMPIAMAAHQAKLLAGNKRSEKDVDVLLPVENI